MARKNKNRATTGYYASGYSKEYNRSRTLSGTSTGGSGKGKTRVKEVLLILLALVVLAAAVFGIIELIRYRQANNKGSGLATTTVTTVETTTASPGSARVLTDDEKDMLRNSEKFKNIMAHKDEYPSYLIDDLEMNPEILDFVDAYLTTDKVGHGGLTAAEKKAAHPLFLQWDKRWGYSTYGEDCLAISGCGPTALAMVAFSLTRNEKIDPYHVAQYAMENGYYVNGVGTAWSLLSEGGSHYGLTSTMQYKYTEDELKDAIEKGGMVIVSVGPGDFTVHSGHFIVLYGYKNGKFQVNDPFSYTNSSKLWDYNTLERQSKNMWIFYKNGSEAAKSITTTTAATTASTTAATTYATTTTAYATTAGTTGTVG